MSARRLYPTGDLAGATVLAIAVQVAFFASFSLGGGKDGKPMVVADLSDEAARPVSVAIQPVPDDLPLLNLGGKKQPSALPDMWQKKPQPKASEAKKDEAAAPSTQASLDTASSAKVTADAGPPNDAESLDPIAGDAATDPTAANEGSAAGSKNGTETDPLKAHAVDQYKAQISAWFAARFNIRGKVPFDTLKTLRATAVIDVTPDRRVGGYDVVKTTGNDVFDDQLYRDLAKVQVSGAVLPPPPENYPDILGSKLRIEFKCTVQAQCE